MTRSVAERWAEASVVVAAVLMSALALIAAPAFAVYPPGSKPVVSTNQQVYLVGDTATITSFGCPSGTVVNIVITPPQGEPIVVTAVSDGPVTVVPARFGTVEAAASPPGTAVVTYVPSAKGTFTVTATCVDQQIATTSFMVVDEEIPSTGTDVTSTLVVAILAVAIGAGLYAVARVRRRPAT